MRNIILFIKRNRVIVLSYASALLIFGVVSIFRPGFGSISHLRVILMDAAVLGMIALGQTFVIITSGIDLSIPWMLTSSAIFLTRMSAGGNSNLFIIIPIILLGTTTIGLINGLGISYLKIPPIIMTLGMNSILMGGLLGITRGSPGGAAPSAIEHTAVGTVGPIPVIFLVWIVIIAIATIVLTYSTFGRRLYAIGNSETVALFSGVNVRLVKLIAYCISGFTTGLSGIFLAGRIGQSYLGMGDPFLFQSVIAVAVGGASILGGSGHYIGTVAGALILTVLNGLLPVFKMPTSAQQIVYGVVLLAAIMMTRNQSLERG